MAALCSNLSVKDMLRGTNADLRDRAVGGVEMEKCVGRTCPILSLFGPSQSLNLRCRKLSSEHQTQKYLNTS